jgi:hypothetical protein
MNSTLILEHPLVSLTPILIVSGALTVAFIVFFICLIVYIRKISKLNCSQFNKDSESTISDEKIPKFVVTPSHWTNKQKSINEFCNVKHLSEESLVYDVNMLNK